MKLLLSAERIREVEEYTINQIKLESDILMERAAVEVAFSVMERFPDKNANILIVCGQGNNGADGLCVGRILIEKGYNPVIYYKQRKTDLWAKQFEILSNYISFYNRGVLSSDVLFNDNCDVLVDALFGIGINRNLSDEDKNLIDRLNTINAYKLSIDVPSGLNSTSGCIYNACFNADETICIGALKKGLYMRKGPDYSGKVSLKGIGLIYSEGNDDLYALDSMDIKNVKLIKAASANKGTYGKTLVIAGSKEIYGAAYLAACASLKSGAGMVKVISHINNKYSLEHDLPEAMSCYYDSDIDTVAVNDSIKWCNTVVIGPGLSKERVAGELIDCLLDSHDFEDKILIADADAINVIASDLEYLNKIKDKTTKNNIKCVFTPHKKELARLGKLVGVSDEEDICRTLYETYSIVTVNKDHNSLIYGDRVYINMTGNEGMATAGSGDVLSGILGGLLYRINSEDFAFSCAVGVWIHGICGDIYASEHNSMTLTASSLTESLSKALDFLT